MFSIRHKPEDNLYAHLVFSLKYEGVNLWILNALFKKIPQTELEEMIQLEPAGAYSRRIWFLDEWLTGADLADKKIRFVDVLDDKQQEEGRLSKRARKKEFNKLTQEEISAIESKFQSIFYNKDEY